MQHYREKAHIIEAMQFKPDGGLLPEGVKPTLSGERFTVETSEGMSWIEPGDWIVRGASGAIRVCLNQIFESLYEPIEVPLD